MDIIERLNAFAKTLDTDNTVLINKTASSLVKTAQYVGSQGYWVANSRCWGKCYREKRATSPKLSAQEVWTDIRSMLKTVTRSGSRMQEQKALLRRLIPILTKCSIKKLPAA